MSDTAHTWKAASIRPLVEDILGWYFVHGVRVRLVAVDGLPFDGLNWPRSPSLCYHLELAAGEERARVTTYPLTGAHGDYASAYGAAGPEMMRRATGAAGGTIGCTIHQSDWH